MTYSSFLNRFSAQLVWKHNKRNFQPPANIGSPSYPASSFSLTSSLETATPTFSTPVLTPLSPHVSGSGKLCARVAKSGYILPKRFASSNISFIAFLAPAELELKKRSIDEFSGTQGSCGSYWENTVKRSQIWHLIFTYVWQLICVDCFTCFSTVGSLRVGRKRTFFVLPKFPPGRKSNASAPPPQVNTLLIDRFWSCLTKARLHAQDFVCPREARKPGGEEGDLCARANRKFLFYHPKFFLPVPLGFTGQGCFPFTNS